MKFHGIVGFSSYKEVKPDVWRETIVERHYTGEKLQIIKRNQPGDSVNDSFSLGHILSLVMDEYAQENYCKIKYVVVDGVKWSVVSVPLNPPRMTLNLGGIYNARQQTDSQ